MRWYGGCSTAGMRSFFSRLSPLPLATLSLGLLVASRATAQEPAPAAASTPEPVPAEAPAPSAAEPEIRGFQLGVRAGYGRALASDSAQSLTYQTPALLPLVLDAGYRPSAKVYVGLTAQLALAARTDCGGAAGTCSAKDYRVGPTVQYHFAPRRKIDPWLGVGIGYEILHLRGFFGDPSGYRTRAGFVLLDVQLGADVALAKGPRTTPPPRIGPFIGLAVGSLGSDAGYAYGRHVSRAPNGDHEWLTIGARGTLDL